MVEKRALLGPPPQENSAQHPPDNATASGAIISDGFELPDLNPNDDTAPPPYGEGLSHLQFNQPGYEAGANVTDDGRVNININTKTRRLADLLAPAIASQASVEPEPTSLPPAYIPPSLGGMPGQTPPPKLNVVIQIVGSRGDVQPFVALGKVLKDTYGHRVRIATHATFQKFIEENGLEFFSIGGDPAELMAFMVKYPGLMPGFDAITSGEVTKRRKGISEILLGCWRSCVESGNGLGPPPTPHAHNAPLEEEALNLSSVEAMGEEPFVADAIISNPPGFAHIHIAEKLGIPLHMMFTMPWCPTRAFPHPLANVQSSNADDVMTNYLTYTLVEMMTWQGLGDVINRFRQKALDLPPLSLIWAPGLLARLKISWTYCWSPALIPKPSDWGKHIDISGFYFLNLASSFTPAPDLDAFLKSGPPPVYIGFGSIVVDDPDAMTEMIFEAIRLSGVRALVSKGWGGLGADDLGVPEGVFMLGNVPHDWLFEHVSCVVHHGGAGTTAAGIKAGRPTLVVPFFGDQPFWGAMIARAKAGPDPIPYKDLTAEKLAEAIKFCLKPETLDQATQLGSKIREEKGTDVGGMSFHDHLNVDNLRCTLAPSRAAAWRVRRTAVRLSPLAVAVLVSEGILHYSDLKLYRPVEYHTDDQPPDPISAGAASLISDISGMGMDIADMPRGLFMKGVKSFKGKEKDGDIIGDPSLAPNSRESLTTPPGSETASIATRSLKEADLTSIRGQSETGTDANNMPPILSPSQSSLSRPSLTDTASTVSTTMPATPASPDESASIRSTRDQSEKASSVQGEASPSARMNLNNTVDATRGVGRIVTTGVKSPMNFCLGLAKGFRNIPRLYNDDTVRPMEKVTGFGSGVKVAGKELGYGFFDGVAGLVTQPIRGAEKDGAAGLVKGFGKGIGGLIAKPAAGIWGIPAYTMQGVHAEITKRFTRSVHNHIVTARAHQGQMHLRNSTQQEREDILRRWKSLSTELSRFYQLKRKERVAGKRPADEYSLEKDDPEFEASITGWRKNLSEQDWRKTLSHASTALSNRSTTTLSTAPPSVGDQAEMERAIHASVVETSRGDAKEDAEVEAAIRESVRVVQQRAQEQPTDRSLEKGGPTIFEDKEYQITDEEYQELIQQAIRHSLTDETAAPPQYSGVVESNAAVVGPESQVVPPGEDAEDANLQKAIEASRNETVPAPAVPNEAEDDELQRAIEASKETMAQEKSERTEEDIVMEYIKKQSLAEEEHRKRMREAAGNTDRPEAEDEEEQLRKALEESLKTGHGDAAGPSWS